MLVKYFLSVICSRLNVKRVVVVVIVWQLDLQLPMQSVPITTEDVSSNPAHGEVS